MFNESVKMALAGMLSNKLRTFLTLLGISIGVGAVIVMVNLGMGVKEEVRASIARLGSNTLIVRSGGRTSTGARIRSGEGVKLKLADAKAIADEVPGAINVAPTIQRGYQMVAGNQNLIALITGTNSDYGKIRNYNILEGRNINDRDMKIKSRICVISRSVAEKLFPDEDAMDQTVRINKAPFRIVGIISEASSGSSADEERDIVLIPLTTVQTRMMGINFIQGITVQAVSESMVDAVQGELEELLRIRHRIHEGQEDDFTVNNMAALMDAFMENANNITLLLGCIAAISLLVGGIGIMNIMLVSVTERTKEIGIRKAIGAKYSDILLQFLVEAAVIGIVGGLFGIILGIAGSYCLSFALGWKLIIYLPVIFISVIFSVGIGVFFGIYPARRAARLAPIDALRYE